MHTSHMMCPLHHIYTERSTSRVRISVAYGAQLWRSTLVILAACPRDVPSPIVNVGVDSQHISCRAASAGLVYPIRPDFFPGPQIFHTVLEVRLAAERTRAKLLLCHTKQVVQLYGALPSYDAEQCPRRRKVGPELYGSRHALLSNGKRGGPGGEQEREGGDWTGQAQGLLAISLDLAGF
jgi:hypothetical protein